MDKAKIMKPKKYFSSFGWITIIVINIKQNQKSLC